MVTFNGYFSTATTTTHPVLHEGVLNDHCYAQHSRVTDQLTCVDKPVENIPRDLYEW